MNEWTKSELDSYTHIYVQGPATRSERHECEKRGTRALRGIPPDKFQHLYGTWARGGRVLQLRDPPEP